MTIHYCTPFSIIDQPSDRESVLELVGPIPAKLALSRAGEIPEKSEQ